MKTALPLTLVTAVAVLARTWQLSQNDFGRQYYAAGVRSMLDNWHNFIFNAFDPAGFVSIDKPPVAIWLQAASAKLLGFLWDHANRDLPGEAARQQSRQI